MTWGPRLIARIALFSALCYVFGWLFFWIPNVNLMYLVVFSAGFLWGPAPGAAVGMVGMWLWSAFNPGGPTDPLTMFSQIVGMVAIGLLGALFEKLGWHKGPLWLRSVRLGIAGAVCTAAFFLPVSAVDAWLYRPFWPRFIVGMSWSVVSAAFNCLAFALLFSATLYLYGKERNLSWSAYSSS